MFPFFNAALLFWWQLFSKGDIYILCIVEISLSIVIWNFGHISLTATRYLAPGFCEVALCHDEPRGAAHTQMREREREVLKSGAMQMFI